MFFSSLIDLHFNWFSWEIWSFSRGHELFKTEKWWDLFLRINLLSLKLKMSHDWYYYGLLFEWHCVGNKLKQLLQQKQKLKLKPNKTSLGVCCCARLVVNIISFFHLQQKHVSCHADRVARRTQSLLLDKISLQSNNIAFNNGRSGKKIPTYIKEKYTTLIYNHMLTLLSIKF